MGDDHSRLHRRDLRIMDQLRVMACDVPPVKNARLAAAVAIRGTILSLGNNQLKSHPFHLTYGKNEDSLYWHAETHAVYNFLRRYSADDLLKATLYVTRVKRPTERSRDFVLGMARPCRGCMSCISTFGIPRIVYSDNQGEFVCEVAQ